MTALDLRESAECLHSLGRLNTDHRESKHLVSQCKWIRRGPLPRAGCLVLNPRFPPTIRLSLTTSQVLRRPPKSLKLFKTQHNVAEKAGVGGSTPSLATIILKNLAESPLALPVRSQSASICVAENRSQHCPCRSHAILADTV